MNKIQLGSVQFILLLFLFQSFISKLKQITLIIDQNHRM